MVTQAFSAGLQLQCAVVACGAQLDGPSRRSAPAARCIQPVSGTARSSFAGVQLARPLTHRAVQRRGPSAVRADSESESESERLMWPDPKLIEHCKQEFPDAGVANVEEARALYENLGYKYVDVRPALEVDYVGKFSGAINVPVVNSKKAYNREKNEKYYEKTDNPDFIKMIQKKFPDKKTKILVVCSDGTAYSMKALMALDDAGYTNIVGLQGGYYAWFDVFDHKLRRRTEGEYKEDYSHGADSCGIHASGAGFEKMDAAERWVPPRF